MEANCLEFGLGENNSPDAAILARQNTAYSVLQLLTAG